MLLTCPRDNFVPVGSERREGEISSTYSPVVYLSLPTSNHNWWNEQNGVLPLYIFRFLHQTTTHSTIRTQYSRCISFASYIKPQRKTQTRRIINVVYLSLPTSNHNPGRLDKSDRSLYIFRFLHQTTTSQRTTTQWQSCISFASYIKPQRRCPSVPLFLVVYLSLPTSNHNGRPTVPFVTWLYIFRFLHQTTTK